MYLQKYKQCENVGLHPADMEKDGAGRRAVSAVLGKLWLVGLSPDGTTQDPPRTVVIPEGVTGASETQDPCVKANEPTGLEQ